MFNKIEDAIEDIKNGKMVIVVDDEDRENEGDLIMAAEKITPSAINFMTKIGRGLICAPLTSEEAKRLNLPPMVGSNTSNHETAFTVSIDYLKNTTTGISDNDRYQTLKAMTDPKVSAQDFARPGHIFPLIAKDGGTLERPGHTEAAVDLADLAGLSPVGVICEILKDNGEMARVNDLTLIAQKYKLKLITIKDLIEYRKKKNDESVILTAQCKFPNKYGDFQLKSFALPSAPDKYHLALCYGDLKSNLPILTRIHSECFTGDIFASKRCDCGEQLDQSMKMIAQSGRGVLIYMRQEGRGIGLVNKIKAYALQEKGRDTVEANHDLGLPADDRDYSLAAKILIFLGVKKIKLLTNNPLKLSALKGHNFKNLERVPLEIMATDENAFYLETKKDKLGHLIMKTDKLLNKGVLNEDT